MAGFKNLELPKEMATVLGAADGASTLILQASLEFPTLYSLCGRLGPDVRTGFNSLPMSFFCCMNASLENKSNIKCK